MTHSPSRFKYESPEDYIARIKKRVIWLSEKKPLVPLGTITGYLRIDQGTAEGRYNDNCACKNEITHLYTTYFSTRPDYQAWCILAGNYVENKLNGNTSQLAEYFLRGLENSEDIIVWGTLVLLACLREWQERELLPYIENILGIAEERLHHNLAPIKNIEVECALVSMRFKFYHQFHNYKVNKIVCPPYVREDLLNTFCHTLKQIDPLWKPGQDLNYDSMTRRLITYHPYDIGSNIATSFYQLRHAFSFSYTQLNENSSELLNTTAECMKTAWLVQRSLRTAEEKKQFERKNGHGRDIDELKRREYGILHTYIHTLNDSGDSIKASSYGWYFLQTLPKGFEHVEQFNKFPTKLAGSIRQIGLTVDRNRYPYCRNDSNNAAENNHSSNYRHPEKNRIKSNPNFIALGEEIKSDIDANNTVVRVLKKKSDDSQTKYHQVSLALDEAHLVSAAKILSKMECPPIDLVLKLSEIICEQCRVFPLALDKDVMKLWLETIHKAFKASTHTDEQCFSIHKALKVQLFTSHSIPSTLLVEKLFNLQLTDEKIQLQHPDTGYSEKKTNLTRFLGKNHQAVYVSIINMGDMISIVATDGEQFKSLISLLNIQIPSSSKLKTNLKVYESNKKLKAGRTAVEGVDEEVEDFIDKFLKKMVEEILELSTDLLNNIPTLIYLSPPTEWVSYPWQFLFYFADVCRKTGVWSVVSIVPNIEWIFAARRYRCTQKKFKHLESHALDIAEAVSEFRELCNEHDDNLRQQNKSSKVSIFSLIAHGLPPSKETPFATIAMPDEHRAFTLDDWLSDKVMGFEAYILHSCSTGRVIPLFSGNDYGGAPGLILMLKGKVVLAPCVEMATEVALMLQKEIFEQSFISRTTYFDVYRAAIEKDERVLFYSLFGLATLPLLLPIETKT